MRDFWVLDCVCGEPDSGEYHISICRGMEDPSDATGVHLANPPVPVDDREEPGW